MSPLTGALLAVLLGAAATDVQDAEHEFHFVVLGDSQFHDPPAFNRIIDDVRTLRPAFVLQVGDMIRGYTDDPVRWRAEWQRYKAQIAPLGSTPFVPVPGNHDLYGANKQPSKSALRIYEEEWGPAHRTFTYENGRFLVLNSDGPDASGRIDREQLQWLEETLQANNSTHVFAFLHRPPASLKNAQALHDLFRKHGVSHVFYGHHHHYHFKERHGVRYIMTNAAADGGLAIDEVGSFDHLLQVAVRDDEVSVAVLRADSIVRTASVTPEDNYQLFSIVRGLTPESLNVTRRGAHSWQATLKLDNPASRRITVYTACGSADNRWDVSPTRIPAIVLDASASQSVELTLSHPANRVPEGLPTCTLTIPFQTSQGAWVQQQLGLTFEGLEARSQ